MVECVSTGGAGAGYFSNSRISDEGVTPNALASLKIVVRDGWRSPLSRSEINVRSRSQSIPSCACDSFFDFRNSASRLPNLSTKLFMLDLK